MPTPPTADRAYLEHLAATLDLGDVLAEPVVIKSGNVDVWRVATSSGDLHIKRFRQGDWDWLQQSLAACAEIELGAQRAGVEMAEPIVLNARLGADIVSVHRWWEGRVLQPSDDVAAWLGGTLAKLHTVPEPTNPPARALHAYYGYHPAAEWTDWFSEGRDKRLPWALEPEAGLAAVLAALEIIGAGLAAQPERAGSHHDLHSLNVLTNEARFVVIDWDCAGPEVPWFETVRAAVEFGRLAATRNGAKPLMPDPTVARAVIAAYTAAGGQRGIGGPEALAGVFGMMLWRIAYSTWHSLGHRASTPEELEYETNYVTTALPKLIQRISDVDALVTLMGL